MKNKKLSLADQIAKLRKDSEEKIEKEIRCLETKERVLTATGLDVMVCDHGKWRDRNHHVGIWIELKGGYMEPDQFDRFKIKEYHDAFMQEFNVVPTPSILGFSTGDDITTASHCVIRFDNNHSEYTWGHTPMVSIEFNFTDPDTKIDYSLDFKLPSRGNNAFALNILEQYTITHPDDKRGTKKYPRHKTAYQLDMFKKVRYSGHQNVIYIDDPADQDEFLQVAFFGHVEEFADRFKSGSIQS
jgi:hypothetical protein